MKIFIFHAEAGYGHKKAAEIIGKSLIEHGSAPQDIIIQDALDYAPGNNKQLYLAFYYYCVKLFPKLWGWLYETSDQPLVYQFTKPVRVLYNHILGRKLVTKLSQEKPDVIISTHFFSAEVAARTKRKGKIDSKLITVITDFMPHTLWINEGTDTYWVMHEETKQEMIKRGIEDHRIIAGGIPVDPIFKPQKRRSEILKQYGFSDHKKTLLITSGSFGIGAYHETLQILESLSEKIQCFVVCGNNQAAYKNLEQKKFQFPVKVFGFVNFMADLMEASDLMIAKSGGLTSVESLAKGIPMVITQPIPGQETRNADFLRHHEASFFIQFPAQIKIIIQNILGHPHLLEAKKEAIRRLAKPDAARDLAYFIAKIGASPSHESSLG